MGINARLFVPLSVLVLAVCGVRYSLLVRAEIEGANAHYQTESQELTQYLSSALPPLVDGGDVNAVGKVLASVVALNRDIRSVRCEYADERIARHNRRPAVADYPGWFSQLVRLEHNQMDFPLPLKNGNYASVSLMFEPTLQINRIWHLVTQQGLVSALAVTLIFLVLAQLLAANRRMLQRLSHATDRFQQGDYDVRMAVNGSPEARAVALTFNRMADNMQSLVGSLQLSQKKLSGQLSKTLQMQNALQQLSWQSYHDVLTGLPNRAALMARIEQYMFTAREQRHLLAVCLLDLDHFQQINDTIGAELADTVLKQVADRLRAYAGERQYVARLGGDEFVLLLGAQADTAAIEHTVGGLLDALSRPYPCGAQQIDISVSAGVAVYAANEVSTDTLFRHADQALYQAKLTGRNKFHFFDHDLDQEVRTYHSQRTEIRQGLQNGQFRLHYQPKVNMRTGRVIGMEALLRWQHPERGVVGPLQFLPLVENTDLIIDIGEWVLRQALTQMEYWIACGQQWVTSVNIAARHFQRPDFVLRLEQILDEFPTVPAATLELELLESSALDDVEHICHIMTACQELGITFALDDFGTGYSSMSYLKRLPANILKIDQSFVRNMLQDQDDLHLVGAVIGLARAFGLQVIAEGVETVEHGSRLMELGCDLAQGYGIARPMPAELVLDWAAGFTQAPAWRAAAPIEA